MLDAVLSLFADNAANVLIDGTRFGRFGSGHPDLVPYQAFPASDGYFIVACLTNAFFKRVCLALGREDWLTDPNMASNPARVARRAEVVETLSAIFRENTCEHWIALLEKHDVPSCKVMTLHEILADPQIAVNGLIHSHEDAVRGKVTTLGPPVSMSATPTVHERGAPILGEHTVEVLREYGLNDDEVAALRAANVIN
jgi:crotonobetainyl-CoA:carnitine CoA-transferase CaiB-like acyl-CoA transferase